MPRKNKEDDRRYYAEWRKRPDVILRRRELQRARRATAEGRVKGRDGELRRRYGITLEDYERMFAEQQSCCAICKGSKFKDSDWHVDHDHGTGRVRGILCRHCNRALGAVKDSVKTLINAIAYLRR